MLLEEDGWEPAHEFVTESRVWLGNALDGGIEPWEVSRFVQSRYWLPVRRVCRCGEERFVDCGIPGAEPKPTGGVQRVVSGSERCHHHAPLIVGSHAG